MPPKKTVFHEQIKSLEQFEKITSAEFGRMAIIDAHLEWCGPCVCMEPNYQALWFSVENPEARLSFW